MLYHHLVNQDEDDSAAVRQAMRRAEHAERVRTQRDRRVLSYALVVLGILAITYLILP